MKFIFMKIFVDCLFAVSLCMDKCLLTYVSDNIVSDIYIYIICCERYMLKIIIRNECK